MEHVESGTVVPKKNPVAATENDEQCISVKQSRSKGKVDSEDIGKTVTSGEWTRYYSDRKGKFFYSNRKTGKTTWKKPKDFCEPRTHVVTLCLRCLLT